MVEFSYVILDKQGLHARPVAMICSEAHQWGSDIVITCRGAEASATDLMGLMALDGRKGDELVVRISGEDEAACAEAMRSVFTF
jgi:phosphocarrier protein HPr